MQCNYMQYGHGAKYMVEEVDHCRCLAMASRTITLSDNTHTRQQHHFWSFHSQNNAFFRLK